MLRLMSNEDIKDEFRGRLTKSIWCPALDRYQALIFCFACSRFSQCDVTRANDIQNLTVEDVMVDPASLVKSVSAQTVKSEVKDEVVRRKTRRSKAPKTTEDHKPAKDSGSKGSKRDVIVSYLKGHPKATVSEIAKSCGVSQAYARKVLRNSK